MVKLQELSIGNFVDVSGHICIITDIQADGQLTIVPNLTKVEDLKAEAARTHVSRVYPVFLNNKQLNQLSFIKSSVDNKYYVSSDDKRTCRLNYREVKYKTKTVVTFWYFEVSTYLESKDDFEWVIVGEDIKYMHTLQNLYTSMFRKVLGIDR